jgi:hypothetical protein
MLVLTYFFISPIGFDLTLGLTPRVKPDPSRPFYHPIQNKREWNGTGE